MTKNLSDEHVIRKLINDLKTEIVEIINKNNYNLIETFKCKHNYHDCKNAGDLVKFNIGGRLFVTYRWIVCKQIRKKYSMGDEYYEPNLLEQMLNGTVSAVYDQEALFIDRNPRYFDALLDYLRYCTDETNAPKNACCVVESLKDTEVIKAILNEAEFYKIHGLIDLINIFNNSSILNYGMSIDLIKLCEFSPRIEWLQIYKASRDGFSARMFHQKCDSHGDTLTVVKTKENFIFGGFTRASWSSLNEFKRDPSSFVFSLTNQMSKPIKLDVIRGYESQAIYCNENYGPTFGSGHAFFIATDSNKNKESFSNLSYTFKHPNFSLGAAELKTFFAGSYYFQVSEVEVYKMFKS